MDAPPKIQAVTGCRCAPASPAGVIRRSGFWAFGVAGLNAAVVVRSRDLDSAAAPSLTDGRNGGLPV